MSIVMTIRSLPVLVSVFVALSKIFLKIYIYIYTVNNKAVT